MMNLARVSANGQITVPVDVRRNLGLKEGDKVLFFQRDGGEMVIQNASLAAIEKAQKAFKELDYSEEEILADIMQMRYGDKKAWGS
jgi:AbrB family looped-hinge helix DNA binding protein